MYKPIAVSLEDLRAQKQDVMNKIINGEHLDALSMSSLQNQLKDLIAKIEEAKRGEVASGQ
jgi:hypothetical protein